VLLGRLVTAGKQDDQRSAPLLEIDAVAGTVLDSQFRHSLADRLDVAESQAPDPSDDAESRLTIAQSPESGLVLICLANLNHQVSVSQKIRRCKRSTARVGTRGFGPARIRQTAQVFPRAASVFEERSAGRKRAVGLLEGRQRSVEAAPMSWCNSSCS